MTADGKVIAWGWNAFGRATVPASLAGKTVTAVAAGSRHSLALTADGRAVTWGANDDKQTGVPTPLGARIVTSISAGGNHSLVTLKR